MKTNSAKYFIIASSLTVLAAIGAGLMLNGSPAFVRAERLDDQRLRDFLQIQNSIGAYQRTHDSLPVSLDDIVADEFRRFLNIKDPETGEPYSYRVLGASTYELCADFENASDDYRHTVGSDWAPFWNHGRGRHCFAIDATENP